MAHRPDPRRRDPRRHRRRPRDRREPRGHRRRSRTLRACSRTCAPARPGSSPTAARRPSRTGSASRCASASLSRHKTHNAAGVEHSRRRCSSPSPTSPRAATSRPWTPSAPPSAPGSSTRRPTRTTTARCSRSTGSPGRCTSVVVTAAREAGRPDRPPRHEGVHPRVGALDVAPIVYLDEQDRGAACAEALLLADRLGTSSSFPVFLYGELAGGRTRARAAPSRRAAAAPTSARAPAPDRRRHARRRPAAARRLQRVRRRHARQAQDDRGRDPRATASRRCGLHLTRADRIVQVSTNIEDHRRHDARRRRRAVRRHAPVAERRARRAGATRPRSTPSRADIPLTGAPLLPLTIFYPPPSPWPRPSASAGPSIAATPPASSRRAAAPAAGRPPTSRRRRHAARARARRALNKPPTWQQRGHARPRLMAGLLFVFTQIGAVRQQDARSPQSIAICAVRPAALHAARRTRPTSSSTRARSKRRQPSRRQG